MGKVKDITNQRFGRLVVEKYIGQDQHRKSLWLCKCDCGGEIVVSKGNLLNGNTKSCGCLGKENLLKIGQAHKKANRYDLTGEYGIGYASNTGREFYFDLEDYDKISKYCWFERRKYIGTADKDTGKIIMLHKLLTGTTAKEEVDHINRKPWDNRKSNLRICTHFDNMKNMSKRTDNTSGVSGVVYDKSRGKWSARIECNKRSKYLGRFDSKDDAIKARLKAEVKYFGEFAPQKHLLEQYGIKEKDA